MSTTVAPIAASPGKPPLALFRLVLFLPLALLLAVLLGGAAGQTQAWFAPLVIFPLLVGVVFGVLLVGLMRITHTAHRPTVLVVTLLAAALLCVIEHYLWYWMAQRAATAREDWKLELARAAFGGRLVVPEGFIEFLKHEAQQGRKLFGEYVARGAWVWWTWGADALLTVLGTLAVVIPALRFPYCRQCRSWYRTTRSGRLKSGTMIALAEAADVTLDDKPHRSRYRLLGCLGGCEPTGLELLWRDPAGESSATLTWMSHDQRDTVVRILDQR